MLSFKDFPVARVLGYSARIKNDADCDKSLSKQRVTIFNLLAHYFSSVLHFVLHSESQLKAKYKNKIDQDVSRLMEVTICQKAFGTSLIE